MTNSNQSTAEKERQMVNRVSLVTITGNVVLSIFKLIAGILGRSGAMVSDAIHSMSDVVTTVIAFLGVRMSQKEADKSHPYGHERLECVASLILGITLFAVGCGIGSRILSEAIMKNWLFQDSLHWLLPSYLS